jgi:hypothetical protein
MDLNFRTRTKKKFTLTLEDGQVLVFNPPKKKIMDLMTSLGQDTSTSAVYETTAKILSENLAGVKFTAKDVDSMWDFEDIAAFIEAYGEFIAEIQNKTKN